MEISVAWTTILKIIVTGALVYVVVPALLVLRDAFLWWVLERSLVNSTLEKAIIDRSNALRALQGELGFAETIKGSGGSTPFPRTVLKRRTASDPEQQLYVASSDYGTAQCSRIRQLALRSEYGNAGGGCAPA